MPTTTRYELIFSDGYSIERIGIYNTLDEASTIMRDQYNEYDPNDPDSIDEDSFEDDWSDESYIDDQSAVFYNHGEGVYCWKIFEI